MERTATLLADLLGCPVSTGFVASCLTRLADKLDCFEADLKAALAGADQLYHDETPVPVNGGTGYVYAARADGLVWYGAHEHRSHANTAEQGVAANAPGVKGASKEAYKLANRMAKRIDQVLYFTADFDVDWTNNSCEQAIRMAKLQAKISGSWRSMRGLKAFCRIRSYIATARRNLST